MLPLIDQLAKETFISTEKANYIFNAISCRIVSRIPALEKVIADVFENTENDKLEKDLTEMVTFLHQQQWKKEFKTWTRPNDIERINYHERGCLF